MSLSIPAVTPEITPPEPTTQSEPATASAVKQPEDTQVRQLRAEGQTPSEIAVDLSIPPATVNSDLFIGIPKMPGNSSSIISLTA